jgi:hypothetical protein
LDWGLHPVSWAGFGLVPPEDVNQLYIYMLSSIKLPRTAPLVSGILESDDHDLSFREEHIKKLHTIYDYRNVCMIALRGSKIPTSYHDIGSRVKHRKTGIDDQSHQPSDYDFFIAWTYPAFADPEPCLSKL